MYTGDGIEDKCINKYFRRGKILAAGMVVWLPGEPHRAFCVGAAEITSPRLAITVGPNCMQLDSIQLLGVILFVCWMGI